MIGGPKLRITKFTRYSAANTGSVTSVDKLLPDGKQPKMNNLLSTVTSPTSASRQYKDSVGRFAFQYRCAVRKGLVRKRGQPLGTVVDVNKDFEVSLVVIWCQRLRELSTSIPRSS